MAHEVAHGVARHSTERLTKVYGLNTLLQLLVGEDPGLLEQIAAQLVGSGVVAKFSRNDEREADQLGLQYLYDAGYNPEGMASMFETLLAQRQRRPNALERFFASHPLTEERITNVRQEAEQMPANDQFISQDQDFQRFKQRVRRYSV